MTHEYFVSMLEGYYGPYPRPAVREAVLRYVREYAQGDLELLAREVLLTYSGQYKHTPDIAVLEKAKHEVNDRHVKKIGRGVSELLALPEAMDSEMTGEERMAAMRELAETMAAKVEEAQR